jgi:hypothetical protein
MRLKIILSGILFCVVSATLAQVPHDFNVSSNGTAERVARFKVQDDAFDFLEITNSTQHANKFIPKIWGHQQSDNRFVLDMTASTRSNYDSGNIPLMTFRSEIRNSLNLNAPSGGTFPWGTSLSAVINRPLFGWFNATNQVMTLRANGNLGLGTISPTARLHTNGTVRFQNLPNSTNPTYMLGTDASGNVREYPVSGGGSDFDWLKTSGGNATSVNDNIYTNGRVGIGTNNPTAQLHTTSSLRFQNLPNGKNPRYLLGTDSSGNVYEYEANSGGVNLEKCLLPLGVSPTNHLTKITTSGDLICSQVFDNGLNVGVGTIFPDEKLTINGIVKANGAIFISDEKFKKEIKTINNSLNIIIQLRGKSYYWKRNEFKDKNFTEKKQFGFLAQEVEAVLPEVVHSNKNGEKGIDYIAIIPHLVESIKEQQNQITILQNKLSDLTQKQGNTELNELIESNRTSFSTNYPNPFATSTKVDYFITKEIKDARIVIYNANGTTIKTYKLNERGTKSQLTIEKNGLKTGIYFYTLIVDNTVIGT